jgi:hypothetical protein
MLYKVIPTVVTGVGTDWPNPNWIARIITRPIALSATSFLNSLSACTCIGGAAATLYDGDPVEPLAVPCINGSTPTFAQRPVLAHFDPPDAPPHGIELEPREE